MAVIWPMPLYMIRRSVQLGVDDGSPVAVAIPDERRAVARWSIRAATWPLPLYTYV